MRWDNLLSGEDEQHRLPGYRDAAVVRRFDAPEALETRFALLDDLGAGLDHLGEHDEAVRVLRDKLHQQEAHGDSGRKLYTTYANLGTFLIHASFGPAQRGDAAAKRRLREGLGLIRKAIEVNPHAHFDREIWQAVAATWRLSALAEANCAGSSAGSRTMRKRPSPTRSQ